MQHVIVVFRSVEANVAYSLILLRMNGPRNTLMEQEPVEIVVAQLRQTGARHVCQFHFGFFGGGVASVALGNVGNNRTGCLRHLVELAVTGVVGTIEMTYTKILCGQLYDIGQNPGVKPIITGFIDVDHVSGGSV